MENYFDTCPNHNTNRSRRGQFIQQHTQHQPSVTQLSDLEEFSNTVNVSVLVLLSQAN